MKYSVLRQLGVAVAATDVHQRPLAGEYVSVERRRAELRAASGSGRARRFDQHAVIGAAGGAPVGAVIERERQQQRPKNSSTSSSSMPRFGRVRQPGVHGRLIARSAASSGSRTAPAPARRRPTTGSHRTDGARARSRPDASRAHNPTVDPGSSSSWRLCSGWPSAADRSAMVGKLVSFGHGAPAAGGTWPRAMPATGRSSSRPTRRLRRRRRAGAAESSATCGSWLRLAVSGTQPRLTIDGAAIRQPQRRQHFVARPAVVRHVVEQKLMLAVVAALQPQLRIARQFEVARAPRSATDWPPAPKSAASACWCCARCHCQRPRLTNSSSAASVSSVMGQVADQRKRPISSVSGKPEAPSGVRHCAGRAPSSTGLLRREPL